MTKFQKFKKNPIKIRWQIFDNYVQTLEPITQDAPYSSWHCHKITNHFMQNTWLDPFVMQYWRFSLQKSSDTLIMHHILILMWIDFINIEVKLVLFFSLSHQAYPCTFPCMFRWISDHNPTPQTCNLFNLKSSGTILGKIR